MANEIFEIPDWRLLRYFSVIAEESSLRRAADRLCMTQPPLSRHMKRLEEMLGLTLFTRHSKGLTLTREGLAVLRMARPVLEAQDAAGQRLRALGQAAARETTPLSIGLTTAFEQGIFAGFIRQMGTLKGSQAQPVRYVRQPSPQLARGVQKGRLDAALVALPLEVPGVRINPLHYAEPLLAALPAAWLAALPRSRHNLVHLHSLSGKPLFWFKRESNPAYFDHMRGIFAHVGFAPVYLEEPEEYDVLLARIAQGEGMGLLPRSFSAIGRKGLVFCPLAQAALLELRLGLAQRTSANEQPGAGAQLEQMVSAALPFLGGE